MMTIEVLLVSLFVIMLFVTGDLCVKMFIYTVRSQGR